MMKQLAGCLLLATLLLVSLWAGPSRAGDAAAEIESTLTRWMADFNAGKADRICDLFAAEVRADYRGFPTRDHRAICDLLTKSLADESRTYRYSLDIKEILVFGDVAVVRLVWTLSIRERDGKAITSVEPGMDIFQRQADGEWKIIRYMAYEE